MISRDARELVEETEAYLGKEGYYRDEYLEFLEADAEIHRQRGSLLKQIGHLLLEGLSSSIWLFPGIITSG